MSQRLKFAFFILATGCTAWFAPAASADEWNKQTVLTFNEPVEIPGRVLPAGTYVFRLADGDVDRNMVQIFAEDQQHLIATVTGIPDYRVDPTGKTVVTFDQRPAGSPEALHAWFYPGDNYGIQFLYASSGQENAATSEQQPQPPTPAAKPQQAATEQQPTAKEQPAADQSKEESLAPVIVRERSVIIAQVAPADNPTTAGTESVLTDLPDTLPKTAGNFAIIPLLGIVLLSGGFTAFRFASKQN